VSANDKYGRASMEEIDAQQMVHRPMSAIIMRDRNFLQRMCARVWIEVFVTYTMPPKKL